MSYVRVGADLDQMQALTTLFGAKAEIIRQLVADISRAVGPAGGQGDVYWEGQVANRFRDDWNGRFVPNLQQLVEALTANADYIGRNRAGISQVLNGA